ncbi:DUF6049 family protein [Dermatobacter hominis]|uniref:DUF6049 family protein n=1 Tax=Dermatobacter hominis TaxID=2884263 RepID=UPI001D10CC92|nr:DUF6049 family protein [Dermatobacter hominis]UDY34359.1 DUF6049 family protein [Dermatobacter hominis]
MSAVRTQARPTSATRTLLLVAGIGALLVAALAPGAGARPAQDPATTSIRVTSATPWVQADGDFRVELRVEGPLPPDAVVRTAVHQRLRASGSSSLRDAVDRAIAGEELPGMMQSPQSRPLAELGDPTVGVVLDVPIRSSRSGTSDRLLLPNPGVHPVSISVTDAAGEELASTTVFLNRLPDEMPTTPDGAPATMSLSLFTLVDGPAALSPTGESELDAATRSSLAGAATLVSTFPQAPLTLAVRPNLLDALSRSEDPADRDALRRLRDAVADPGHAVTVARMPYVAVDTGGLVGADDGGAEVLRQVALGNTAIREALGTDPAPATWFDDTVTTPSLELLEAFGVQRLVTAADRVRLTDRELDPVAVTTSAVGVVPSPLTATSPDPDLTSLLAGDVGVGQRANQVVTALMATWFTASGSEDAFPGPSAVLSIPPSTDPAVVAALLAAVSAPGPITTAAEAVPPSPAVVDGTEVTGQLPAQSGADQGPAVRAVVDTRARIDGFRSMAPSATAEAAEWELLDAQTLDRTMTASERDAYHSRIAADIDALAGRIEMPKSRRVLLTSQDSTIPLRFRNDLPYDVEVEIWVRSVRLDVEGADRRVVTLHPGENRIDVEVTTRAPGGTTLRVDASSPDGEIVLPSVAIPVSSSTISGVGAALSVLSLLFLAGWWFLTIRRDRRRRRDGPGGGPPPGDGTDEPAPGPTAQPLGTDGAPDGAAEGSSDGAAEGGAVAPDDDPPIVVRRPRGAAARAGTGR